MSQDDVKQITGQIADALGETLRGPRRLVREIVEHCGVDFAQEILKDTNEVMALGGMLTSAGDRLRTKGGVFFYLARGRMTDETRLAIFPPRQPPAKRRAADSRQPAPPPVDVDAPEFEWDERLTILPPLLEACGEARDVKITLIGRPGKVETRKDVVITAMSHSSGTPTFPRGIPDPPDTPTLYTVYISAKQWKRIEDTLNQNPDDMLIVEGMCAFDPEIQAVAVYATKATTKNSEAEKRRAPTASGDASGDSKNSSDNRENGSTSVAPARPAASAPAAPSAPNIPQNMPASIAKKLRELHAAAELYRQKIATIEARPANEQFGLEMTQKLLKNVEDEINALQKPFV